MFKLALRVGGGCLFRPRFPVPAGMHRKGLEHVGQLTGAQDQQGHGVQRPAAGWLGAESGRSLQIT